MTRRKQVNSHEMMDKIARDVLNPVQPPTGLKLRKRDKFYWNHIVNARLLWTDIDLIEAYHLARMLTDLEKLNAQIDEEGYTRKTRKGGTCVNPAVKARDTLIARIHIIKIKIQVHAKATIGEVENNRVKNAAKQKAVRALRETDDTDELIKRPVH